MILFYLNSKLLINYINIFNILEKNVLAKRKQRENGNRTRKEPRY